VGHFLMPILQTAAGAALSATGSPELGAPMMMSGVGSLAGGGIGQAAGGNQGSQIGSSLGGMLGSLGGSGGLLTPPNPANAGAFGVGQGSGGGTLGSVGQALGLSPSPNTMNMVAPGSPGVPTAAQMGPSLPPGISPSQITDVSQQQGTSPAAQPSQLQQGVGLGATALGGILPAMMNRPQQQGPQPQQMQPPQPPSQAKNPILQGGLQTPQAQPPAPMPPGPTTTPGPGGGGNQMNPQMRQVLAMLGLGGL